MSESSSPKKTRPTWVRLLPLAVLIGAMVLVVSQGWHQLLSFDSLREHRETLLNWTERNGLLAVAAYIVLYAAVTAMSLPVAVYITLAGGFLFGAVGATLYTVVGATIGACLIFLIASTAIGDSLRNRAGPMVKRMEDGFRENAFHYMLVLRLIPGVPFWAANLVPALLGVRFSTFAIATFVGIIPGTAIFCLTGEGLGKIFESQQEITFWTVMSPQLLAGLIGLAVLAIAPVAYKKWRARDLDSAR